MSERQEHRQRLNARIAYRSEERRVGKECRLRGDHFTKSRGTVVIIR